MTSGAVHRWNAEIQEGIFNMAELFIDMCVARLQHLPIHHEILNILTLVILYVFIQFSYCRPTFIHVPEILRRFARISIWQLPSNVSGTCTSILFSKFRISPIEPVYLCLIAKQICRK